MATSKTSGPDRDVGFDPEKLDRTAIALPLLDLLKSSHKPLRKRSGSVKERSAATLWPQLFNVIIDPHLSFPDGREKARDRICELIKTLCTEDQPLWQGASDVPKLRATKTALSRQYVFARLSEKMVRELVKRDRLAKPKSRTRAHGRAIYRIWPDFEVHARIDQSIRTVKADAAGNAFGTAGASIVWAVLDSGIDALHPHFEAFRNLDLSHDALLAHKDLSDGDGPNTALIDRYGHGTHVAGIIAGQIDGKGRVVARTRRRDETGEVSYDHRMLDRISGMAPRCKLLSLKVLADNGAGEASSVIVALEYIQQLNEYGRLLRVHGVNLSAGYKFEPEWFACGQSPLCVEVDRLVKSGVVVVVAAGNTGYGQTRSIARGDWPAGLPLTINDPGNAELAITVGSTHREMPHVYGVSYFSSKGPTGDGRAKPDLVAPGEKIISCTSAWAAKYWDDPKPDPAMLTEKLASWQKPAADLGAAPAADAPPSVGRYREDSGTSMAAPHVSGVIAAFLSVRREFIGRPERVKEIFTSTATDLKRERSFQGAGLVDLMRAIQSV